MALGILGITLHDRFTRR